MYRPFIATVAAVLVVGFASTLMAQETESRMRKGMDMMKSMDVDGNGEISREEFVQAHEKLFDRMDENGDGTLDQEEQASMMRRMHHRRMEDKD